MMDYIPGEIHESYQKEYFFLMNSDFVWSNCRDKRLFDMDIGALDETIELSKGDVVVIRFFKSKPTSSIYAYLERVHHNNGDVIEYKKESIISLGLIEKNKSLFGDVTRAFEREKKIHSILFD